MLTIGKDSLKEMDALPSDMTMRASSERKAEGTGPKGGSQSSYRIEASESTTTDASRPRFEFPYKLHTILEDAAREGNEWIVSWLPHGSAFKVHSRRDFEACILPRYFGAPKYRSFQRQLAMYGFKLVRDRTSNDFRAYRNKLFVRGMPDMCNEMMRHVKTPKKRRKKLNKKAKTSTVVSDDTTCSTNTLMPPEFLSRTSNGSPFHALDMHQGQERFRDQPMSSYFQEDKELLQFSIEANNFLEASSRIPGPQQMMSGDGHLKSVSSTMMLGFMDGARIKPGKYVFPSTPGGEKLGLYPRISPSHDLLPLGSWFSGSHNLESYHDPTKATVNVNVLAKIGESLVSPDI